MGKSDSNDSELDLDASSIDLDAASIDLDASAGSATGSATLQSGTLATSEDANTDAALESGAPSDANPSQPIDLTGRNLDGLIIQRKLGEGGMGEVWLAHDEDLDIQVAVKVLPAHLAADQGFVMRFLREARAVAKLEHPNIVGVKQAGKREVTGQILRLMVMEYIEGKDALVTLKEAPGLRLSPQRCAEIALACAKALKYAHGKGVIHRDVKPANILISKDGESIKLLDFGLARLGASSLGARTSPSASDSSPSSSTGTILGTPHYMPPEQCEGKLADGRADTYSLGITLYELLTGSLPFRGDTVFSIIEGHVRKPLEFPADAFEDVPPMFRELISGMCEKKPDDRWALKQVIEKLDHFLGHSGSASSGSAALQSGSSTHDSSVSGSRTNIIKRETSFVGRGHELAAIGDLLDKARLVTIVGPGGVGKTRITQEYGLSQAATPDYPGGVWFCDLTEARTADGVCYAVSQGIGVPLTQADSVKQIEAILSMRDNCLMIFDNFEQVVEFAGDTIGRWMAKAPKVKFITSSREPLHLEGEKSFPLRPLSSSRERGGGRDPSSIRHPRERGDPEPNQELDSRVRGNDEAVRLAPAVQLFVDRASDVKRGFTLDDTNREAIAKIVDQLDGIPLAIELAASRCAALPPQKILERLPRRFDLLKGRRQDASARQATLRGAIDWSWNLLKDYEKSALAQCSVFQNGFFLEAAEAVIDLSDFDDAPFEMDVIEALVEKSLLVSYEVPSLPGEARYRMLESIRQYAGEKLEEAKVDPEALLLRHAEHYLEYAAHWDEETHGPRAVEALNRIELEYDNLFGIQESLEHDEPELAARAVLHAVTTLRTRGPWNERAPRLERALSGTEKLDPAGQRFADHLKIRIQLTHALTHTYSDCGQKGELQRSADHCRILSDQLPEQGGEEHKVVCLLAAQAQYFMHIRLGATHEAGKAIDDIRTSLGLAPAETRQLSSRFSPRLVRTLSSVIGSRGEAHRHRGELSEALACYAEAESMSHDIGNSEGIATSIGNRGIVLAARGEYEEAMACHIEAERIHRAIGNNAGAAATIGNQGLVYLGLGELEKALACCAKSEEMNRELGRLTGVAANIGNAGNAYAQLGENETALLKFAEAERISRELGSRLSVATNIGNRGCVLRTLGRIQEAWQAFSEAEAICREMNANRSLSVSTINKALVRLDEGQALEEALCLAEESRCLRSEMGMQKTEAYFETLSALAVIEKRLGQTDAAREHAAQAKALGEELKLDRHVKYGRKKGEVTEEWRYIDEVLGAGE